MTWTTWVAPKWKLDQELNSKNLINGDLLDFFSIFGFQRTYACTKYSQIKVKVASTTYHCPSRVTCVRDSQAGDRDQTLSTPVLLRDYSLQIIWDILGVVWWVAYLSREQGSDSGGHFHVFIFYIKRINHPLRIAVACELKAHRKYYGQYSLWESTGRAELFSAACRHWRAASFFDQRY